MSSYTPFTITEFKTGIFSYLEPWQRPQDAFEPLNNAYIYRGALNKRAGYKVLGDSNDPASGKLAYTDFLQLGDGSTGPFTGSITTVPIIPGTLTITDGTETFTSDDATPTGTLTGDAGGTGTITWATGAYSVTFNGSVSTTTPIYATYNLDFDRPIMGLKTWVSSSTDEVSLIAIDTRRASIFNESTKKFDPINTVHDYLEKGDGTVGPYNFSLGFTNIVPGSFVLTDGTEVFSWNGITPTNVLTGSLGGSGTIDVSTGAVSVTFNSSTTSQFEETYTLAGDYFSGDFTNFFNSTNWNAPNEYGGTTHADCIYLTNNVNPITLYDGTSLSRPLFPTLNDRSVYITKCLDIKIYKNRLLAIRPSVLGGAVPEGPSIRYSAVLNPTNMIADLVGNGGREEAPTSDWIFAAEFLRDQLIVFFKNSTRLFRFTGISSSPFRFDTLNTSKSTNCPYASVGYDERATSVGNKGLIACDGVNVQRYDLGIIDLFANEIDQNFIGQCFSQKFDTLNQTWTLYPSLDNTSGKSDKVLVYNFLENTWSTYSLSMSCLGLYNTYEDLTWEDLGNLTWEEADFRWNEYFIQDLAPSLIGGGHDGRVYFMNYSSSDAGTSYDCEIETTEWNPFAKEGVGAQFGYLDIYYECDEDTTILLEFFPNGSNLGSDALQIPLVQPDISNPTQKYNWQRVFLNCYGQFLKLKFTSSSEGNFKIMGMILWAQPGGRITFGKSFL